MAASTVFCIQCGAANPLNARYCFSCGQAVKRAHKASHVAEETGQIKPGEMLKQRYKILVRVGQGGFGAVYKAEDTELGDRLVAVKEMSQRNLSQRELEAGVEAFKREALMLAGLMHEHLPRIYEHFSENDRWYLVMDYIEGETLEDRLGKSRDGSLPPVMALKIAEQLCEVLEYLHTRQPPIIFRDLKPANIILTPEGNLFLIDFGIARHFKPGQARDTIAFGSPGYAAPEQYGRAQTTPRADIYSLGSILHQMLSGHDPSLSPFHFSRLAAHDMALQILVSQMLEMDEKRRPSSIAIVRQRLQKVKEQPAPAPAQAGQPAPMTPILHSPPVPGPFSPHLPLLVHEHHYGMIRAISWSPDSRHAASATDAIIRVWNAQNGQKATAFREHVGAIKHMAWSPIGSRIASISEENRIRIWDSYGGQTLGIYPCGEGNNQARVLDWSRNGRLLAIAGCGHISVLDTNTGEIVKKLKHRFREYRSLSWSPDGSSIAAAYNNKVLVWQPDQGKQVSIYHYKAQINTVAWSPNGMYLACGGYDHLVHVWNMHSTRLQIVYSGHVQPVCSLSWSPDSRCIVSASFAPTINVWGAMSGVDILSYFTAGMALAVAWSPDGHSILSGDSDRRVCVWRAP